MTDKPEGAQDAPPAQAQDSEKPAKSWRSDYRFLILAGLILAVLAFNVIEHLLLDTDEADMRLDRLVISGSRVSDPQPGNVYAFSHANNKFVESKICALQIADAQMPNDTVHVSAYNVWGKSINETVASVSDYVGDKIVRIVTVDNPTGEWTFQRHYRSSLLANMDQTCIDKVEELARGGSSTLFVVDAVYIDVSDPDSVKRWVGLSAPIVIANDDCPDCPAPKQLKEIIKADVFNRFKVEMNIVTVE